LVASLYSVSSIANHEHVIHRVGVSKLKARLQKAAESGETLDLLKYLSFLTLVCGILPLFVLVGTDQKVFIHRMSLVNWVLVDHLMHWMQMVILVSNGWMK
jgi:hypothetical protein